MQLTTLACGPLNVNSYIACADGCKTCFVVDPGDGPRIKAQLDASGLSCTHILITHGHIDHIYGLKKLKELTGAKVCVHADDAAKLTSSRANLSALTRSIVEPVDADVLLHDGDSVSAGGLTVRVLHTPGHSEGGVCYAVDSERVIFCGDTVFFEDAGRTDFPNCSERRLYQSIRDQLFSLDGDYALYPGHEEATTLNHEREFNPLMMRGERLHW